MFEHAHHPDANETVDSVITPPPESPAAIKASLEQRHRSTSEALHRANGHFAEDAPKIDAEKAARLTACIDSLNTLIGEYTYADIEDFSDELKETFRESVQNLHALTEEIPTEVLTSLKNIRLPELRFSVLRNALNHIAIQNPSGQTAAKAAFEQQRFRLDDGSAVATNALNEIEARFKKDAEMEIERAKERENERVKHEAYQQDIENHRKTVAEFEQARGDIEALNTLFVQDPLRTLADMRVPESTKKLFLTNLPEVIRPMLETGRFEEVFAVLKQPDTQRQELQTSVLEHAARALIKKQLSSPDTGPTPYVNELTSFAAFKFINKDLLHAFVWNMPDSVEMIAQRSEKPEDRLTFARALSEPFYPQLESSAYRNYDDALIEKGVAARKELVLALTSLPAGQERDAQLRRATEYCLDPDFGNLEDAATIARLHSVQGEREKLLARIPAELSQLETLKAKHLEKWSERSQKNKEAAESDLIALFGAERVAETVKQIEATSFITINASADAIKNILSSGSMKSAFDNDLSSHKKDYNYQRVRHRTETQLDIRAKGTLKDPHPIYGALGYVNGKEEFRGAAPAYGDCSIRLKNTVKERSTYTYGDSFEGDVEPRQFIGKDVAYAKAKLELDGLNSNGTRTPYVEAQIIGGVRVEDIEEIHIHHMADRTIFEAYKQAFPQITFIYHEATV